MVQRFATFSDPFFLVTSMAISDMTDFIFRMILDESQRVSVRTCRGSKMRHTQALFDEFAAAFQFPYYFGENWAAFHECMADLTWLPACAYLTCITSANEIGDADDYDSFATLVKILNDVARGWAGANPSLATMDREPTPFHVVMQVPPASEVPLLLRLGSLGVSALRLSEEL